MITKRNDKWYVVSEKTGRSLGGPYPDREKAEKRLQQVEYFKHRRAR